MTVVEARLVFYRSLESRHVFTLPTAQNVDYGAADTMMSNGYATDPLMEMVRTHKQSIR